MLVLVLGENMLVTFLGWEGVGTCSYLLIAFWHERDERGHRRQEGVRHQPCRRLGLHDGDVLRLPGHGHAELPRRQRRAADAWRKTTATAIALFCFIGACGKSAQLPLYLWLPDAMEGPTPVSALIHAATMVTAGVFLMCRMSPMLDAASSYAPTLIAIVGAATALFAATIAVAQNDIKKVLAYSTVSQLGYMFLAVGSGAYTAAIFHMVTHAFFKALLFLGSGAVIHGMHHEQDMRRMGALRKLMPITAATFIVGWLAIAGVPPFAGFWSKDDILLAAYDKSPVLWVVGLVTALLTAYYMTRQVIMVFYGEARWHDAHDEHGAHGDFAAAREPGRSCCCRSSCWPCLSIVGGGLNLPFGDNAEKLTHWLEPVVGVHESDTAKLPLGVDRHRRRAARHRRWRSWSTPSTRRSRSSRPCSPRAGTTTRPSASSWAAPVGEAFDAVAWFDAQHRRRRRQRRRSSWCAARRNASARVQSGNVRNYAAAIGVGVVLVLALVRGRAGQPVISFPILTHADRGPGGRVRCWLPCCRTVVPNGSSSSPC